MANKIYDDDTKQNITAEELRKMAGFAPGLEDQLDAETREKEKSSRRIHQGLNAGLYAGEKGLLGDRAKAGSSLAREELKKAEDAGFDFNNLKDPNWYKDELPKAALRRATERPKKDFYHFFVKKHTRALFFTIAPLLVTAAILVVIFFLAPFKHDHFESIIRSVNFARFQLLIRSQFTRVIFESSVLTQESVGTFRNSPLVRQIRLAIPDQQLAQLGESGKVKWEFHPNGSFGSELPLRESLKAVVIDGKKFEVDEFARSEFGKNYADLSLDQKWKVQGSFIQAVNVQLGDLMALMPRHVRFNPLTQAFQHAGVKLVRVAHGGKEYQGLTQEEARAKSAKETAARVMSPSGPSVKPGIPDLAEAVEDKRKKFLENAESGAPQPKPGEIRSRIASRARIARGASDVVFATTSYCVGRELLKIFTPEFQADREAQAMRAGSFDASGTDQDKAAAMAGQARYPMNQKWDRQGEIPDASESVVYKNITGQPVPETSSYKQQVPWLNPAMALGDWYPVFEQYNKIAGPMLMEGGILPGLLKLAGIDIGGRAINDKVCTVIMNEFVQYGIAGAEAVVAVVSVGTVKGVTSAIKATLHLVFHFVAGVGVDKLLSLLIEWVINEYAGLYFTGLAQGADRVGETYVAQNSIAQVSNRTITYGRPLDQQETNAAQEEAVIALREEFSGGSTARRYFALDNPFSLTSLTLAKLPSSAGGLTGSIQSTFQFMGSMLTYPFRLVGSLGSTLSPHKQAYAAGVASPTTTYGVEQWGYSLEEQQRIKNDPSFAVPKLVARVEPQLAELNARYGKCYDPKTFRLQIEKPPECTKALLSEENALYWRHYNALMFSATHLSGSV